MSEPIDSNKQILLNEALARYGLEDCEAELIRHNENMTFRVGGRYLLRIHKHKVGFTTEPLYEGLDRSKLYESELAFIKHLKSCGLNVQSPVPNKDGALVTRLSYGTPATVLGWFEGHTIEKSELLPPLCRKIGEMIAHLHKAAESFPVVLSLRYDAALCTRLVRKLQDLNTAGVLDVNSTDIMAAALYIVAQLLREKEEEFILVHSDLSLSNMLITDDGITPIDFSLSGYCHPMNDLSGIYCSVCGAVNRQAIADGYTAAGGIIDSRILDGTFALNVLLGIILHCESWTKEAWFAGKLEGWCKNIFVPLTQGKPVAGTSICVILAEEKDIPAWLTLINMVSEDFPGLDIESYTETLKKNIARGSALCAREDGKLGGILLFSPDHRCLSCMAVHPGYRRHGIASALISEMLRRIPDGDISVTTFREDDPKGIAPRALYRKFGFEPDELLTEFDYPVQRFVLHN